MLRAKKRSAFSRPRGLFPLILGDIERIVKVVNGFGGGVHGIFSGLL
jgi:hypothetical protein